MNRILIAVILLFASLNSSAITPTVRGHVSSVHEASGIDFTGGSSYWTHNDGYGDNKLYKLSGSGSLTKTITVNGATNQDWEDITSDVNKEYMYIGDFGNNNQNRTNLRIYKITYPSNVSGNSVNASVIKFSYPDQNRWPAKWWNFDAEAFFHLNGLLYIFTKADGNAIGHTKLYTVPDQPGNYIATFIDSFEISGRITGADVSRDGHSAVLISNTKIYLFKNFTGSNVFTGMLTKIKMDGGWTQKEGVCFNSDESLCIVDEGSSNKLYEVNLGSYLREGAIGDDDDADDLPIDFEETTNTVFEENIYPNPAASYFNIRNSGEFENAEIILSDMTGKVINTFTVLPTEAEIRVETELLENGIYFIQLVSDNERKSSARVLINH
jgi:hypothetical protein